MKTLLIHLGFECNNNCRFCWQTEEKKQKLKTNEEIKKIIDIYRKRGYTSAVFASGEPTIRKGIFECVSYAKRAGFKVIGIHSNGRMFYYKKFCRDIISAGANDFVISLHGPMPEMHDYLTQVNGSWKQTVQGIRNLTALKQPVAVHVVVVKSNYLHISEIVSLLIRLKVRNIFLRFVYSIGNAKTNFDNIVPFQSLAAPYIKKAVKIAVRAKISISIEGMPYCILSGMELHISNKSHKEKDSRISDNMSAFQSILFSRCKNCRFNSLCKGVDKEYVKKRGLGEFGWLTT